MPRDGEVQLTQRQTELKNSMQSLMDSEITAFDTKKADRMANPALASVQATEQKVSLIDEIFQDVQTTEALQITDDQKARLESIRARGRSHLLLNERSRFTDSAEMKEIKFRVGIVERLLDEKRAEVLTKELYEKIEVSYQLALNACKLYLDNPKKKQNRRKAAVRSTYLMLSSEATMLDLRRKDLEDGQLNDKTLADLMHLSKDSGVLVARRKNTDAEKKEISDGGYQIAKLFSGGYTPNASVTAAGSSHKARMKAVAEIKKLKDTLRSIPEGKVTCVDTVLVGQKVKLLQRADNSLCLVEGHMQFPLELSAVRLADKIEADMASNYEIYGENAVKEMFEGLSLTGINEANGDLQLVPRGKPAGEVQRIRQICLDFLSKKAGISAPDFTNISTAGVLEYAKELSADSSKIEDIKRRVQAKANRDEVMINSNETLSLIHANEEREKSHVVFKEADATVAHEPVDATREWSKKEQQLLDMFADMIFEKKSWKADERVDTIQIQNDSELFRRRLADHKDAIYTLLREPNVVGAMLDKLDIPGAQKEGEKTLGAMLKEGYGKFQILMLPLVAKNEQEFKEQIVDNITGEEVKDIENNTFSFLGFKWEKKTVYSKEQILEVFDEFFNCIEPKVEEITDNLQEIVCKASEQVFGANGPDEVVKLNIGSKKNRRQEENNEENNEEIIQENQEAVKEVNQGANQEAPKEEKKKKKITLQSMMEDLVRGKKGAGRFNKLVLNNYFDSVSMLDKKSMVASMIRNLKPKGWAKKSREEYCQELKDSNKYEGKSFIPGSLSPAEEEILRNYEKESMTELMAGNMLGGFLKGAGPLMHKIMQGLPITGMPASLREALKDMKSNLAPIPREVVEAQLNSMVERSKGSIERIEVVKSLGAASIAQTFLCKCFGREFPNGRDVAIKIIRPDVRNRMMRERDIMRACAEATDESGGMLATYDGILKNVEREMDFTIEAEYAKAGKIYNNKHADVKAMDLNDIIGATTNSMVVEKADGTTVDKYLDDIDAKIEEIKSRFYNVTRKEDGTEEVEKYLHINASNEAELGRSIKELRDELARLEKRRNHVCNVADLWVREGMLKSGFYHGDLHAGNIMIDDDKATIIDFGNATQLKPKQQKYIIGMVASAIQGDTNLFMECFKVLLGEDNEALQGKEAELKEAFREVLYLGTPENTGERIVVALLRAQELGVEVPASIWGFAQGQQRLMNSIAEMNAKMSTIESAISTLEAMGASTGMQSYIDPIQMLHDRFAKNKAADYESDRKQKVEEVISSIDYDAFDEKKMLKELDDTKVDEEKEVDKIAEFESKYLSNFRLCSYSMIRPQEWWNDETWAGQEKPRFYKWHSPSSYDIELVDHLDYRQASQALKDYYNRWKNDINNPQRQEDKNSLRFPFFIPQVFDAFGGRRMVIKIQEAIDKCDGDLIKEITDVFDNKFPVAEAMIRKYEELRMAQEDHASSSRIKTLKKEFVRLYKEANADKNASNTFLNKVLSCVQDEPGELLREIKNKERDEAILNMCDRRYFDYIPEELTNELKNNYTTYQELRRRLENKIPLTPEERRDYGVDSVLGAKNKFEAAFIESYRKVALLRLKKYHEGIYKEPTKVPENKTFLHVMADILGGTFVIIKMAWKVRWKLGWRIFRSESNAKKQKEKYFRQKREEQQRLRQNQNKNAAANKDKDTGIKEPIETNDEKIAREAIKNVAKMVAFMPDKEINERQIQGENA